MKTPFKWLPVTLLAGLVGLSHAAVNFPFPQNSDYDGNGITLTDKTSAATSLKSAFKHYYDTFYNESGNYAGIRSNAGSSEYFSEGVGYGMLMMVYFSDNTKSYQGEFDKLWAFYQASADANGLMNWKIGNLDPSLASNIWGKGAATDAEMDVAAALILAARQFGNNAYNDAAATLLANVRKYEFETNGLHKPGDSWNDKKNPSYVTPAYYELFKSVDTDGAAFWDMALDVNYELLETNSAENSTGLFDNWSNASGTGLDGYYGYDASRTPWRLAQAYYWYGQTRAYTLLNKLGTWANGKSATAVSGSIQRNGTFGGDHNSTFVATLMTSLVTSPTHQTKLDQYWKEAVALGNENYFNQSLKVLCGLAVSGNMPVFSGSSSALQNPASQTGPVFTQQGRQITLANLGPAPLRIDLVHLNGKVMGTLFRGTAPQTLGLSLPTLEPGLHLVRISQGNRQQIHKIIVP